MKIIGHPFIPHEDFSKITSLKEIDQTLPNAILWWKAQEDKHYHFGRFCQSNAIPYAVEIQHLKELLIYINLNAKYLIASQESILTFQSILKEYVLDALLLCKITDEEQIKDLALKGIDGVIFETLLQSPLLQSTPL